jgi:hypothetical protein
MLPDLNIPQQLLEKIVVYGFITVIIGYILVSYGKILIMGSAALFSVFVLSGGAGSETLKDKTNVAQVKELTPDEKFLKECEELTSNKLQCIELLEDRNI